MQFTFVTALLSLTALTAALPSSVPLGRRAEDFQARVLKAHNDFRATEGAKPLTWSPEAAAFAQTVVNTCVFKHSGGKFGENLAAGAPDSPAAIKMWTDEKSKWKKGMDFSMDTGHYTQVVWKETSSVGCAAKKCPGMLGNPGGSWFMVCEYNKPGNVVGQYAKNVQ